MTKQTKSPKPVIIHLTEIKEVRYKQSYTCPTCGTVYEGFNVSQNATQFLCNCGQELRVSERRIIQ